MYTYMEKVRYARVVVALCAGIICVFCIARTAGAQENDDDFDRSLNRFRVEQEELQKIRVESQKENQSKARQNQNDRVVEKSRAVLERSIDVLLARTTQLKKRVDTQKSLYGDLLSRINQLLLAERETLNDFLERIRGASNASELRVIAQDIKSYRDEHGDDVGEVMILAHLAQLKNTVLAQATARADALGERLGDLKNDGRDTKELEVLLGTVQEKITEVQKRVSEVERKIAIETLSRLDKTEIQKTLSEAQSLIKDIYGLFRTIALRGSVLFGSSTTDGVSTSTQ